MAAEKFKRKITAILSADVSGYSRMMGQDEEGTLRTLTAYKEAMTGFIQKYQGRVVGTAGDSVLAEFASVVDTVRCATEVQDELKTRNADLPENRRMEFRIGINLGDVVEEGDTIYGDGVNVASRLESLADAGGICISGIVYDLIEKKLSLDYEYLGEQTVKNIEKPVRVYRVLMEPGVAKGKERLKNKVKGKKRFVLPVGIILAVFVAVIIWQITVHLSPPKREVASKEKMAFPLPDKPSIAVLPFANMSADKDQEYFSDGMTEDLITDLSKISGLLVIARNSTFTYKGKAVKVKQVAEELGVRYVLEGSVRRAGDEIRINAQLIDAMTGHHLWAERYDGTIKKIFALQDQITQKIVSALAVKLTGIEKQTITDKGTNNIEAYEALLQGYGHYLRLTPEDLAKAIQSFKKAIELDPNYGRAHAALAFSYRVGTSMGGMSKGLEILGLSWLEARLRAGQYLNQAMKNPSATAHAVNSQLYLLRRQHEEGVAELEKAVALDPNDPACNSFMGTALILNGKGKEGIEFINRAMRLDPHNPGRYVFQLGVAQFNMGNLEESANLMEKARRLTPEIWNMDPWLASIYGLLGREKEAHLALDNIRKGWGSITNFSYLMYHFPFKERAVADRFAEGLMKAGMKGLPSGYFPAFKENQLSGEEIKKLLSSSKITGIDDKGQPWWIEGKKNGEIAWRGGGPNSSDTGNYRIEGDLICYQYNKNFWGIEYCQTVFGDPKGTYERKNEYFFCTDWGFSPWSIER